MIYIKPQQLNSWSIALSHAKWRTSCCVVGNLKSCMILGHYELKHKQLPAEHAQLTLTLSFYSSSFRFSRIEIKGSAEYRHFMFISRLLNPNEVMK
jgi:hypothetical protein